jgi:bifunctional UDP-N-acetylglucosamine pyrophosphorylase/glucosamine-1-phosphate N-acetyltransferase
MDAVILAAGLGTRLRPHTLTTPKPLLPVQGRPILDWIIAALPRAVDRLVVVTHYLADQVGAYLKGQRHVTDWTTVHQEKPRGTGDALMACRGAVRGDRFFVLNGDDLYGAGDLAKLAGKSAGLLGRAVYDPRKFGVLFPRAGSDVLERIVEKPEMDGPALANIGAYLFPRRAVDFDLPLSPRGEYEITDAVARVAAEEPFHVVPATFWLPIGTIEAWDEAQSADLSAAASG